VVVAGHEAQSLGNVRGREAGIHHRRHQFAQQHQRPGAIAVVRLVAHVEHLRHDRLDVDGAVRAHRRLQHRRENACHPPQPGEHVGGVRAVTQHSAQPLVERAVRQAAAFRILQYEQPHRRRHHSCHRPDGARMVARREVQPAGLEEGAGLRGIVDQALECGSAQ
jgi:hypothetical protein